MRKYSLFSRALSIVLAGSVGLLTMPFSTNAKAASTETDSSAAVTQTSDGFLMKDGTFSVKIGKYGQISSLKIVNDSHDTDYVLNPDSAPNQAAAAAHEWMGELMLATKTGDASAYTEAYTSKSDSIRKVEAKGNSVVVTYSGDASENGGIKGLTLTETYTLQNGKLRWDIKISNSGSQKLTVGDLGLPLAFNEIWPGGEVYETQVVYHSFVGQDSSYVYASRPSGDTPFLLLTPDTSTGAGFEYQDHWCTSERSEDEAPWCQDQDGWANGLNVFYVHSDNIKKTNRSYLPNTKLELGAGESKDYAFNFSTTAGEDNMKSQLYENNIIDATAVPSTVVTTDSDIKVDLHTSVDPSQITPEIQCIHDLKLYQNHKNTVDTTDRQKCTKNVNTSIKYNNTVTDSSGQKHHIYTMHLSCLGQNNVVFHYKVNGQDRVTTTQFYAMAPTSQSLETHANFMVNSTQWDANGKFYDKIFDDWNMDRKAKEGNFDGGWGDDWGPTKAEFLSEKNVYQPKANQIQALDEYLDIAVWNNLMKESQETGVIHNWISAEPNKQRADRGFSYVHFYNTFFSMYKIASRYPGMIHYTEKADTYLMRCYLIMKQLYGENVGYSFGTGLMGEMTVPEIISALKKEGHYTEAQNVTDWMDKKYQSFKDQKYPYGSEYAYDNTGEEAVYTLAKLNLASDTANASTMLGKIDKKTRICRGVQPVWYHYGNPTTNCGENWWNFQYTASLAGYCMDDYLRLENNGWDSATLAEKERVNYAAKLANLTNINMGQIDASPENIGATAWSYQSELGNVPKTTWDAGVNLHNGWRGWSGESDLGLFGVMKIMSSDVVTADPIFGLYGYGCTVAQDGSNYTVTPHDGLNTRLNFIQQKLSVELERDQYTQAVVNPAAGALTLSMKNLESSAHSTDIKLTGMKAGNYVVKVDGTQQGGFQSKDGETSTVGVKLPASASATVTVESGDAPKEEAPTVEAGPDQTTTLSKPVTLTGSVQSNNFSKTFTDSWAQVSGPDGGKATIANADQLTTKVSFNKAGTYTLKLTASDGTLSGSDTVTVQVEADPQLPETVADYTFETIQDNRDVDYIPDTSSAKNDAIAVRAVLDSGKNGKALKMNGSIAGGYVKLQPTVTGRLNASTVTGTYYLDGTQQDDTHLFEFGDMDGHYLYVSVGQTGNLTLAANDLTTGALKTAASSLSISANSWVQITVTDQDDTLTLYVNGEKAAQLDGIKFFLGGLSEVQRNYIGRSYQESYPFLNGKVDDFKVFSRALTVAEIASAYGVTDAKPVSGSTVTTLTKEGTAPKLPDTLNVAYSDGTLKKAVVKWDSIDAVKYAKKGISFTVNGSADGVGVQAIVYVVSGTAQNVALEATANAQEYEDDLGTAAKMNDGFDPTSSADKSHGLWHNWNHNQNSDTWVEYDWPSEVVLTGMDMYYHENNGNFVPVNIRVQYKTRDGKWVSATNCKGLGNELNQYNTTTFDPVQTTALRVTMTPKQHSVGVIEWKVSGYGTRDTDISALNGALSTAASRTQSYFTANSWSALQSAVAAAQKVKTDASASQDTVDEAVLHLNNAIGGLTPTDGNYALSADVAVDSTNIYVPANAKEKIHDDSTENFGDPSYGWNNWGQSKDGQVTYTWQTPVTIGTSKLFFFSDGAGVQVPDNYFFEYLDSSGKWQKIDCDTSGKETGKYNVTSIPSVTTTALRVNLNWRNNPKDSQGGVGLMEWQLFGSHAAVADKSMLQKLYDDNKGRMDGGYTASTWNVFQQALTAAKNLLNNAGATQAQVDAAATALQNAVSGLKAAVDKTVLQKLYDENSTKTSSGYTASTWNALEQALTAAKNVLNNVGATQAQVYAAATALQNAVSGLRAEADKTALQKLYNENSTKTNSGYTASAWNAFEQTLTAAKNVLNNAGATQAQIDAAENMLQNARKALDLESPSQPKAVVIENQATGITVSAGSGVLPEDVQLVANVLTNGTTFQKVWDALKDVAVKVEVLQLSLKSSGRSIEPDGSVYVTVPIPSGFDKTHLALYYIAEDGSRTQIPIQIEGNQIVFKTTHFSTYALVQTTAQQSPQTGDTAQPWWWITMCAVSSLAAVILIRKRNCARK